MLRAIDIRAVYEERFAQHNEAHPAEVNRALAYLTTWGLLGYQYVDIFVDREGDMTACYYRNKKAADDGERPGFVMGGVFSQHDKTYSFHS